MKYSAFFILVFIGLVLILVGNILDDGHGYTLLMYFFIASHVLVLAFSSLFSIVLVDLIYKGNSKAKKFLFKFLGSLGIFIVIFFLLANYTNSELFRDANLQDLLKFYSNLLFGHKN